MTLPEKEQKQIYLAISQRLRKSRKKEGVTLEKLAATTGFTKGYLSQIETGKRDPTISALTKIAYALNVDTLYLLSGVQPDASKSNFTIVRANERRSMPATFDRTGLKYESLPCGARNRLLDAYIVEIGLDFPPDRKPFEGFEFVFTLEGTHEFVYDGESHILHEGDAYYFDPIKPHTERSIGSKPSKVLVVFTHQR